MRHLIVITLASLALASTAHAQTIGFGAHAMPTGEARITPRWDNYLFTGNHTDNVAMLDSGGTVWASALSVQADFRTFVVNLSIPMAFLHTWATQHGLGGIGSFTDDQFELGNIELEGYANIDIGAEHRLLIGGGLALPTATDQLNPGAPGSARTAYGPNVRAAAWHTSFRNPAAWTDQAFTIWPTASYRFANEWLLVRANASIPIFFPTHGTYGAAVIVPPDGWPVGETPVARGQVELMFAADVSGAIRLGNIVDIGASLMGWALPSGAGMRGNPDLGQTAVSFFAQTDDALDFPLGAGFEWIVDLDDAWGPTGGDRRFWGAHFYIFGRIDVGDHGEVSTPDLHPEGAEHVEWPGQTGGTTTTTTPTEGGTEATTTTTTP
jgi:hypothetical protein